jgi:hypothetical protein
MAQNIVAGDLMVGACKLYTGPTITDAATDLATSARAGRRTSPGSRTRA